MYNQHFGLSSAPFKITPDPHLFFTGGGRGEVLEALVYAITSGEGIIKVVGEVGVGKTMLCRMLETTLPKNVETVYLANPSLSPEDILHAIALEMGLAVQQGSRRLEILREIQAFLLSKHARNEHVVVLVEEAQSMPNATLEEIRLLSNLETGQNKLLQIVLFGQPELNEKLRDTSIRQLRERITHSFDLEPLNDAQVRDYVSFRLRQVGYRGRDAFRRGAYRKIAKASQGLTRRVNILADKSLLAAFAEDTHDVSGRHVRMAIDDSQFVSRLRMKWPELMMGLGGVMLALALGTFWWLSPQIRASIMAVAARNAATVVVPPEPSAPSQPDLASGAPSPAQPAALAAEAGVVQSVAAQVQTFSGPATVTALNVVNDKTAANTSQAQMIAQTPSRIRAPRPDGIVRTDQLTLSESLTQPAPTTIAAVSAAASRGIPSANVSSAAPAAAASSTAAMQDVVVVSPTETTDFADVPAASAVIAPTVQAQRAAKNVTAAAIAPIAQVAPRSLAPAMPAGTQAVASATPPAAQPVPNPLGDKPAPDSQRLALAPEQEPSPSPAAQILVTDASPSKAAPSGAVVTGHKVESNKTVSTSEGGVSSSLVEQRLSATRDWLRSVSGSYYSIQLLLTDTTRRQDLEEFLRNRERAGELGNVYVYETVINRRTWFGVLYRAYPTFSAARRALQRLPPDLSLHEPFIRNVRDISTLG